MKNLVIIFLSSLALCCEMGFGGCKPKTKQVQKAEDVDQAADKESLYQTSAKWDNQLGDTIQLAHFKGKIPVVTMVFTRCTFACPKIVSDLKAIERKIPDDKKDDVVFVMVSFDSDRDRTPQLKAFSKEMKLGKNWQILHGNEDDVRELSMLLNVKYKKQPNGDFTHSSGLAVLDRNGAIVYQKEGLGNTPDAVVERIKAL